MFFAPNNWCQWVKKKKSWKCDNLQSSKEHLASSRNRDWRTINIPFHPQSLSSGRSVPEFIIFLHFDLTQKKTSRFLGFFIERFLGIFLPVGYFGGLSIDLIFLPALDPRKSCLEVDDQQFLLSHINRKKFSAKWSQKTNFFLFFFKKSSQVRLEPFKFMSFAKGFFFFSILIATILGKHLGSQECHHREWSGTAAQISEKPFTQKIPWHTVKSYKWSSWVALNFKEK